jgi:hypothetical protein
VTWHTAVASAAGTGQFTIVALTGAPVRYVRITLTAASDSWFSVADVRAYTTGLDPGAGVLIHPGQRGQQQAQQDRDEHDVHLRAGQFQARGRIQGLVGLGHRDLAHPSVLPLSRMVRVSRPRHRSPRLRRATYQRGCWRS